MSKGNEVVVVDDLSAGLRENLNLKAALIEKSILDVDYEILKDFDGVFHLAAIASAFKATNDWFESHLVNQSGAVKVFEAAASHGLPVIYASSAAVYGNNDKIKTLSETEIAEPVNFYGHDKLACESQAAIAKDLKGLRAIGLRFFNVYGARQRPDSPYSGVISVFVDRAKKGEALDIYGDGEQSRDFIHVRDVLVALQNSMQLALGGNDFPKSINVSTAASCSVNRLADIIGDIVGRKLEINHHPERRGDIRYSVGDNSFLKNTLGIQDFVKLEEGLRDYIKY